MCPDTLDVAKCCCSQQFANCTHPFIFVSLFDSLVQGRPQYSIWLLFALCCLTYAIIFIVIFILLKKEKNIFCTLFM